MSLTSSAAPLGAPRFVGPDCMLASEAMRDNRRASMSHAARALAVRQIVLPSDHGRSTTESVALSDSQRFLSYRTACADRPLHAVSPAERLPRPGAMKARPGKPMFRLLQYLASKIQPFLQYCLEYGRKVKDRPGLLVPKRTCFGHMALAHASGATAPPRGPLLPLGKRPMRNRPRACSRINPTCTNPRRYSITQRSNCSLRSA